MKYKIKRKQADGSFVELSLDTSMDSIYRVKDNKSLTDILAEEYAPIDNPNFTGSISLGRKAGTTVGEGSYAVGVELEASGIASHAEGGYNVASAENAHVEGNTSRALGKYSHAEGNNCEASQWGDHAEGRDTTASGNYSHAEGFGSHATGIDAHAEGNNTIASGDHSHAEGRDTIASGLNTHAEGRNTKASSDYQHVQGIFNIEDTERKYAHIVGNGLKESARSNAHTLDWDGNAWFAGEVQGTNLPYVISENTICTITNVQQTLNNSSSEITHDHPYVRSVEVTDFNLVSGENISYFVKYSGKEYPLIMIGVAMYCNTSEFEMYVDLGEISTLANDPAGGMDVRFHIYKIDKSNPTDIVLVSREIKYLDDKYLPKHITVEENIVIGGVGIQYNTPQDDIDLANKIYVDDTALYNVQPLLNYATFEVLSGYTYTDGFCPDVVFPFRNYRKWSDFELDFFYSMERYGCKVVFTFESGITVEHKCYPYNRLVSNDEPVPVLLMEQKATNLVGFNCVIEFFSKGGTTPGLTTDTGCFITNCPNNCTSIKITLPLMPPDINYVNSTVDTKVAALVDSAPETLDTLKELSTALGDDPDFATTVATNIGKKVDKPSTEGTVGQVLAKGADGSNVWINNDINEEALNAMLTDTFGFVADTRN